MGRTLVLAAGLATLSCLPANAQTNWPQKPVTLIVAYPAGGGVDISARITAAFLDRHLKQRVIVENIGGASGAIGAQKVSTAAPDGHTLLYAANNETVIVPLVNPATKYRHTNFQPIGMIAKTSAILFGRPGLQASNIDELIEFGRKNPGKLSLGHSGFGTFQYLAALMTFEKAGVELRFVAYRGAAQIVQDVMADHVDLAVTVLASIDSNIQAGKVKPYGVLRNERDPLKPGLSTINEGRHLKDIEAILWVGMFAPAGTPRTMIDTMHDALKAMHADPATIEARKKAAEATAIPTSPEDFGAFVARDEARFRDVVKLAEKLQASQTDKK